LKLNLSTWALVAEIIASVAVVASLGYLAIQVDENTQATIGETQQNLLAILHERDSWLISEQFSGVVVKAEEDISQLTKLEARQYRDWMLGKYNTCEHVFDRFKQGLMSADHWAGWDSGCKAFLEDKSARDVWRKVRTWFGPAFAEHYDAYAKSYE